MCVSSTSLEFWQNIDLIISGYSLRPQSTSEHPQVYLQGALAGYFTSQHLRELKCTFFPFKHDWITAGNRAPAVLRLLLTSKPGRWRPANTLVQKMWIETTIVLSLSKQPTCPEKPRLSGSVLTPAHENSSRQLLITAGNNKIKSSTLILYPRKLGCFVFYEKLFYVVKANEIVPNIR